MSIRTRIKSRTPNVTNPGGGGSVTGNFLLGPSFGQSAGNDESTFNVGVNTDLLSLDLESTDSVSVDITGDLGYANTDSVSAHLSGSVLSCPNWVREDHNQAQNALGDTGITVTYAAGAPTDGVLLVAFVAGVGSGVVIDLPSGWTTIRSTVSGNNKTRTMYKIASSEGTSQAFTFSTGVSTDSIAEIHQITRYDSTTPVNVTAGNTASVINPVVPAVTTTVANCLVFYFLIHAHTLSQSHTPPANHVERTEYETGLANSQCANSGTRIFAAAATTGTATVTCDEALASTAVYQRVAIAPGAFTVAT